MKIVITTDNFYPELSGITDSVTLFAKTLAEVGHSVLIVAPRYSKKNYHKAHLTEQEPALPQGVSILRLPSFPYPSSPTGQSRAVIPTGFGALKIKKFKPEIIHAQSPFGAGLEALIAAKVFGIPLLGTNHTPPEEFMKYYPIQASWFKTIVLRFYSWYYNRSLFMSAPSQILLDEMKRYGLRTPSQKIPNPLNLSAYAPPQEEEKREIKKKFILSLHTILYTGRLAPEKHVDVILRALPTVIKEVPDVFFVITGHGYAAESLRTLSRELKIESHVRFVGFVPDEDLVSLYRGSDVFVMMSTAETQSLSMMHAMASCLPVIAARACALPEYVTSQNGILVESGDVSALASTLIHLLKNRALSKTLGEGGQKTAAFFDKNTITSEWLSLYHTFAKSRHTGGV